MEIVYYIAQMKNMKKLVAVLGFSLLGSVAIAQKAFIQGGVSVQNKIFTQDAAIGIQNSSHQFAVTGETYNVPTLLGEKRLYFAGFQYGKQIKAGGNNSFVPFAGAKIQLNKNTYGVQFEPGLAYQLSIVEGLKLVPSFSTQLTDNSTAVFKAGVSTQITF